VQVLHFPGNGLGKAGPSLDNKYRVFFDFDNTITTIDVVFDLISRFSISRDWVVLEKAWQSGEINTRECLRGQMRNVRVSSHDLGQYLKTIRLDPYFLRLLELLRQEGVEPVIVSDNFQPIVEFILKNNGIQDAVVYANELRFFKDRLVPSFPYQNPSCPYCAHCKKTHFHDDDPGSMKKIIYIGDGRSDICAALESDIVFAKDDLLEYFRKHRRPCVEFLSLADVADHMKEEFCEAAVAAR